MAYFVIEDFRLGLDARKHILTLPPGSLYRGKNCNINRGGEVESAKEWVATYQLEGTTFGTVSAAGQLYIFGSDVAPHTPEGVVYQRLQHPLGLSMTDMVWMTVIKGKIYAIAAFAGGAIASFYDGVLVADWYSGAVGGTMASNADVASNFATMINTAANFSATALGNVVTITGVPGHDYPVTASAINGGATNDQYATASLIQAAVAPTPETKATGTLTISGASTGDTVSSVKVNAVEVLSVTVTKMAGMTDAAYASAIAAQINAYVSTPEYTASAATGVVTILAAPGTGVGPNGFVVARTITGTAGTVVAANMAGGVAAAAGLPKIWTVTIGGTFEAGDVFSATVDSVTYGGVSGAAGAQATVVLPLKDKAYAIAGPNLFGSAIGNPSLWNSGTGSFVIDASGQSSGAELLTALGLFQNNLAVMSRTNIQVWAVDPDPTNNEQIQVLPNIGTLAPKTVVPFGDADLFFLSDTGLRSLKVRITTNNATLSDVGSSIDPLIIAAIAAAGGNAAKAVGVIDPVDGRYLLQIGAITYAFSFFPSGKVSGWTTWETGLSITDFATVGPQLYARAGNVIYLLGGSRNNVYTSRQMEVKLPFLSNRQIATLKHFTGIDLVCDGTFDVYGSFDPSDPEDEEMLSTISKSTMSAGSVPIRGEDTEVISLRLVGKAGQYNRLAGAIVHYEPLVAS